MKYLVSSLAILFALSNTACKATKALDSTIQMNGKMDKMIDKMSNMDKKMNQMSQMNDKMTGMGQGLHKFEALAKKLEVKLTVAMAYGKAIDRTFTTPADSIPWAKALVEAATTEELLKITKATMNSISGISEGLIEGQKQLTSEEKNSLSFGLNGIGYWLDQKHLQNIVEDHIAGQSEEVHVGLALLAYRAQVLYFLSLKNNKAIATDSYSTDKPTNVSLLKKTTREIIGFFEIAELPFASDIKHKLIEKNFFDFDTYKPEQMAEYMKNAVENGLDCKNVKTAKDKDELNRVILAVSDDLQKYGVAIPKKECP